MYAGLSRTAFLSAAAVLAAGCAAPREAGPAAAPLSARAAAAAAEYFVTSGGTPRGDGSRSNPWDLPTALAGGPLRPVTYSGDRGLKAEYYPTRDLSGAPSLTRLDPYIRFDWGLHGPSTPLREYFSARWTGEIRIDAAEAYTFYLHSDDGSRLFVDDVLVADTWSSATKGFPKTGTVHLTGGRHAIRFEYNEGSDKASVRLEWSSPSTPHEVVPRERLYPPAGFQSGPVTLREPTVGPGSTVWVSGTHRGRFTSTLSGNGDAPVIVRARGRWTISNPAGADVTALTIAGNDTWIWGVEIVNENTQRWRDFGRDGVLRTADDPRPVAGDGYSLSGPRNKLIHAVVHDNSQGGWATIDCIDCELYGNLIYNNGIWRPDRGHGHGTYTQNRYGRKRFEHNVYWGQAGGGVHMYGTSGTYLIGFDFIENASFSNTKSILLGGLKNTPIRQNVVRGNLTYRGTGGITLGFGTVKPACDGSNVIEKNYFFGGRLAAMTISAGCRGVWQFRGNEVWGRTDGWVESELPGNNFYIPPARPDWTRVFVWPSKYERGRAVIAVYNFTAARTVRADLSSVLSPGQPYEIRSATDFYGPPVSSGTYGGGALSLPGGPMPLVLPRGTGYPARRPDTGELSVFIVLPG